VQIEFVAVADSGGNLVAFQRMDGAQLASIQIAEHEARASATFRRETKVHENAIQLTNSNSVLTLDGIIASRGGLPLNRGRQTGRRDRLFGRNKLAGRGDLQGRRGGH